MGIRWHEKLFADYFFISFFRKWIREKHNEKISQNKAFAISQTQGHEGTFLRNKQGIFEYIFIYFYSCSNKCFKILL